jgi:hypothetical protein
MIGAGEAIPWVRHLNAYTEYDDALDFIDGLIQICEQNWRSHYIAVNYTDTLANAMIHNEFVSGFSSKSREDQLRGIHLLRILIEAPFVNLFAYFNATKFPLVKNNENSFDMVRCMIKVFGLITSQR